MHGGVFGKYQTPHANSQTQWWWSNDFGLFCHHRTKKNSSVYQSALKPKVRCSAKWNKWRTVIAITATNLEKKITKVYKSSQSPGHSLLLSLWWDLKRAVQKGIPENLNEKKPHSNLQCFKSILVGDTYVVIQKIKTDSVRLCKLLNFCFIEDQGNSTRLV